MKKHIAWVLGALLLVPGLAVAAEFRAGEQQSIGASERIQNDVYIAGGSVTSSGAIVGDLVAGGGNIIINGDVSADVIAGGGNVSILSNVGDDVRAGGGNIVILGKVAGDVVVGGGQVSIGGPGIGGDVAVGGGKIRIDAPVGGSVKIAGGDVYINSTITGKVEIQAQTVTLGKNAVINGDLIYSATKELTQEQGAVVHGQVHYTPRAKNNTPAALAALFSLWVLGKFLALLIASLLLGLIFRRFTGELIQKATARPLFELGRGLLVLVALPIISILLCVTVLGIPLGMIGFFSFALVMLVAWLVAPIILGSVVLGYFTKQYGEVSWKSILLGAFLYSLLGFIPFLGWLAQVIILLISLGSIVALKLEILGEWR
jgi:hypothetical protein